MRKYGIHIPELTPYTILRLSDGDYYWVMPSYPVFFFLKKQKGNFKTSYNYELIDELFKKMTL